VCLVAEGASWGGIETHLVQVAEGRGECSSPVEIRALLLASGRLADRLRAAGIDARCASSAGLTAELTWLRQQIRDHEPDCVHAHGLRPEVMTAFARPQSRFVVTSHSLPGNRPWRSPGRTQRSALALWLTRRFGADAIVAVTEDIRTRLIESGIPAGRVAVVRNGVPTPDRHEFEARTAVRRSIGLTNSDVVVGVVGRLDPIKRYDRFLRAVSAAIAIGPPFEVILVGEGPSRGDLEALARRLEIASRVHFLGFRSDATTVMTALDIGVFSSDHEGLPFAALELLARGVPLVAHGVGGLKEVIRHGETGLLVEAGSEQALADGIARLASDATVRSALGRAAAEWAHVHLSRATMMRELEQVWRGGRPSSEGRPAQRPTG
jgi:glycosyltransferase involved in cell wall biosynthesis